MLNIAICDDDIKFAGMTESFIEKIDKISGADRKKNISTDVYLRGDELINAYSNGKRYDLIYMDIEMKDVDGIVTAKKIREIDYQVLIIYISSHEEYMKQLFEVEPFRFLTKPVDYQNFCSVFESARQRIERSSNTYYHFKYGKNIVKLLCRDILYFESSGRKIIVHTQHSCYEYYDKLNNVEDKLSGSRFIRIHKGYLVNIDNVEAFQYEKVALIDGTILSISEKNRARIRNQIWNYFHEEDE